MDYTYSPKTIKEMEMISFYNQTRKKGGNLLPLNKFLSNTYVTTQLSIQQNKISMNSLGVSSSILIFLSNKIFPTFICIGNKVICKISILTKGLGLF